MDIVVTGDIRRGCGQTGNVHWLWQLFNKQISWLSGKNPDLWHIPPGTISTLDTAAEKIAKTGWHLKQRDLSKTLTVGFELPGYFNDHSGPVLDFNIHPVRFMDDICFGVKSNFCDLSQFQVSERDIQMHASIMKAAAVHLPGADLPVNTTVFFGQTPFDKSIMHGGRLVTWLDFRDQIKKICDDAGCTVYKPHPYADDSGSHLYQHGFGLFSKMRILKDIESYRLLIEPNVKTVVALSSSILAEARYFDKTAVNLIPTWWDGYTMIHPRTALSIDFWKYILSHLIEVRECEPVTTPWQPNLLRMTTNSWWGYEFLAKRP